MGHIQREGLPNLVMIDLRSKSSMSCFENKLNEELAADLSLQIFNNHWISR